MTGPCVGFVVTGEMPLAQRRVRRVPLAVEILSWLDTHVPVARGRLGWLQPGAGLPRRRPPSVGPPPAGVREPRRPAPGAPGSAAAAVPDSLQVPGAGRLGP